MSFIEEWNKEYPESAGVESRTLAASWFPKDPYGTESLELICKVSGCSLFVKLEDLKELIRKIEIETEVL